MCAVLHHCIFTQMFSLRASITLFLGRVFVFFAGCCCVWSFIFPHDTRRSFSFPSGFFLSQRHFSYPTERPSIYALSLVFFCFALRFHFVFRLTFVVVVPRTSSGLLPVTLFCFAPRFLSFADWLPLVPRTSSRPSPTMLFCFAPRFLLFSDWLPLAPRTRSRPFPPDLICFARGFFLCRLASFCSAH